MTMSAVQPDVSSSVLTITSGAEVNLLCLQTEIPEVLLQDGVELFPNPVTDELTITTMQQAIYSVEIFNVPGEKMLSVAESNRSRLTVDCKLFPIGIYIAVKKFC